MQKRFVYKTGEFNMMFALLWNKTLKVAEMVYCLQSFSGGLSPGPRRLVLPILAPQEFEKRENVRLKWSR